MQSVKNCKDDSMCTVHTLNKALDRKGDQVMGKMDSAVKGKIMNKNGICCLCKCTKAIVS